jgi:hypothetical protein
MEGTTVGGEWEPNKISFTRNQSMTHVQDPKQKPLMESDEKTNQQDRNNAHKVTKLVEEEWDQTDTRLAKYGQNSERTSG